MAIGTNIVGTPEIVEKAKQESNEETLRLEEQKKLDIAALSTISAHVMNQFHTNRDAKRTSGIEYDILDSLRAYNGEYTPREEALIREEEGASIYMNITATKCRAAKSWIMDILTPANEKAWMLSPTPMPELPEEMGRQIEEALAREFREAQAPKEEEAPQVQQGQPPQPKPQESVAKKAQRTITEANRDRRELKEAMMEEIDTEAKYQIKIHEREIHDQLVEGNWDMAFDEFVQDFVVYPTAFMKGPIVTKKPKLSWDKNGDAVVTNVIRSMNKRVNPIDIYPSPDATSVHDGSLIEHIRLSPSELQELRDVPGYRSDLINKVLEENQTGAIWLNEGVDQDLADLEKRGTSTYLINENVIHGLHFFGCMKAKHLKEWGVKGVEDTPDEDVVEIEAILAGNEVIKAQKNQDPLGRRPYYKASYVNIPGSFWGRSLPELMSPTQRMCNATARSLATNLGMSSGPQVELYVDRLADNGDIDAIRPRKIWQVKSDTTGASGRAVTFFNIPSNAKELLEVYREFESRADDVTGIPRYAYGSDPKAVGAATTATGLSMMLESATKIIKDAIRNIDNGLVKPRIEYQFYLNLLENEIKYTGDIHVIPKGSITLTIKAAQNIRRNEFLQITANANDQAILGAEARMSMIREISKDLGLDSGVIPSAFKTRQIVEENEKKAAEAQPQDHGLEVAKMQTESAERTTQMRIQMEDQHKQMSNQLEQLKLQSKQQADQMKLQAEAQENQQILAVKMEEIQASIQRQNQEIALKLKGYSGV